MPRLVSFLARILCATILAGQSGVPEKSPPDSSSIQDNSFLMEEAYNQEEGVVQHINTFQRFRGGAWAASFTQEWPVPRQAHQLSYTIPFARALAETRFRSGLGDIALNYRYQLVGSSEAKLAVAPRLSLLFPTGDEKSGFGAGGLGIQSNVAMSTVVSEKIVLHTNLGATWNPRAKNADGQRAGTLGWNLGQSLVWLALPNINFLVEAVWNETQAVEGSGRTAAAHTLFISPGIRWAWNGPGRLQIVPGIAVPIGVGPSRGDRAILIYLSFEHPMWNAPRRKENG